MLIVGGIVLIPIEHIETNVKVNTWEETVREAGKILLNKELIHSEYIDSMIETVNTHGPYMILAPEICLFHGKPGEMVIEPCVSLIILEETVYFSEFDNQPIKCAFAFGATDSESHLSILQDIAKLLSDNRFKELVTSNSPKDKIVNKIEELLQ